MRGSVAESESPRGGDDQWLAEFPLADGAVVRFLNLGAPLDVVIGVGGVTRGEDVWEKLDAGANLGAEIAVGFQRAPMRVVGRTLLVAVPALALPVLIRTAVVEGVATATEVSTIGIAYAVVAGLFIYRRFDWRRLYPMLVDTAALSGAILFIWRRAAGDPIPTKNNWKSTAIVGTFLLLGGNGLVSWAEQTIPSGIAALIIGAVPLFMVLIEALRPGGAKPQWAPPMHGWPQRWIRRSLPGPRFTSADPFCHLFLT